MKQTKTYIIYYDNRSNVLPPFKKRSTIHYIIQLHTIYIKSTPIPTLPFHEKNYINTILIGVHTYIVVTERKILIPCVLTIFHKILQIYQIFML